jgi:hypothetical protein
LIAARTVVLVGIGACIPSNFIHTFEPAGMPIGAPEADFPPMEATKRETRTIQRGIDMSHLHGLPVTTRFYHQTPLRPGNSGLENKSLRQANPVFYRLASAKKRRISDPPGPIIFS